MTEESEMTDDSSLPQTAAPRVQDAEAKAATLSSMAELIEVPHPSVMIREEMDARDWGTPSMARAMGGDYGINLLALEMYLSVGPGEPGMRLGEAAADIARAFGVSVEMIQNMEASWLRYQECRAAIAKAEVTR